MKPIDVIKTYVKTRDEMLDCQERNHVFSCESCPQHHSEDKDGNIIAYCATREAWACIYNDMNAMANPEKPSVDKLPEYPEMLKMMEEGQ